MAFLGFSAAAFIACGASLAALRAAAAASERVDVVLMFGRQKWSKNDPMFAYMESRMDEWVPRPRLRAKMQ